MKPFLFLLPLLACALLASETAAFSHQQEDPQALVGSMAIIPGIVDSEKEGPFSDMMNALLSYTDKHVSLEAFPLARAVHNVIRNEADFMVPTIRGRVNKNEELNYRFSKEKFGSVCFVLYTNAAKNISRTAIEDALRKNEPLPYILEGPALSGNPLGERLLPSNDVSLSLQKVHKGRVDGFIWAQEESDAALKKLKLSNVRREHWADFDDSIILALGPRGDLADALLSEAIAKMRASGELDKYYRKIHSPYQDWQPAEMNW